MTNVEKLSIAILKSGKTKRDIASELSLSEMGFYKKAKGITEFKASEMYKLGKLLNLSSEDMSQIFFANM